MHIHSRTELNNMEAYATDVSNVYIEAQTKEKVCIRAGPKFKEQSGLLLIIHKALYGLQSSGKEFGDLLASCLMDLRFKQSLAEPEIFMRRRDNQYEYVAMHVNDLCIMMKDSKELLQQLQSNPYITSN